MTTKTAPMPDIDWNDVVTRVGQGDRHAYAALFAHWAPRLSGWYQQRSIPLEQAEELTHDVLARVWHAAPQFDPAAGSAPAWLFTIARNRMIDRHRRSGRFEVQSDDPQLVVDPALGADAWAERRSAWRAVAAVLARLPEEQRRVLELSHLSDRSLAEVAAAQQVPLGTVKTRARLALEHLRRALGVAA